MEGGRGKVRCNFWDFFFFFQKQCPFWPISNVTINFEIRNI